MKHRPRSDSINGQTGKRFLKRGDVVRASIADIGPEGLVLELDPAFRPKANVVAKVHVTDIADFDAVHSISQVTQNLSVGSHLDAKVLWAAKSGSSRIIQFTIRPSELAADIDSRLSWRTTDALQPGVVTRGVVTSIDDRGAWVHLSQSLRGRVHSTHCSVNDDIELLTTKGPSGVLQVGDVVRVAVVRVNHESRQLELTLRQKIIDSCPSLQYLSPGSLVVACIGLQSDRIAVVNPPAIGLQLDSGKYGRVCITDVSDREHWRDAIDSTLEGGLLEPGTYVHAVVLSNSKKHIGLSMRPSLIASVSSVAPDQHARAAKIVTNYRKAQTVSQFSEGQIIKGYVVGVSKRGCFIRITSRVMGRCMLKNLSDGFVHDVQKQFPVGKVVAGRISSVNAERSQLGLNLRPSVVAAAPSIAKYSLQTLQQGMILNGFVRKVESFGVFVNIADTGSPPISGLCHISEAGDGYMDDLKTRYRTGDPVKIYVLKIDVAKKRISLSMKPSYFDDLGDIMEHSDEEKQILQPDGGSQEDTPDVQMEDPSDHDVVSFQQQPTLKRKRRDNDNSNGAESSSGDSDSDSDGSSDSDSDSNSDSDSDSDSDNDTGSGSSAPPAAKRRKRMFLSSRVGFDDETSKEYEDARSRPGQESSDDQDSSSSDSSDSDDDDTEANGADQKKKRTSSRAKKKERRREEAQIAAREQELLNGTAQPQSAHDFERLIVSSPSSSFLWVKYMSFQVSVMEFDAARAVAERALKSINFREENERLNVWAAYLNLEHRFGDEETYNAIFKRAQQNCDPESLYQRAVTVLTDAGSLDEAHRTLETMCKRFGAESAPVWVSYARFLLQNPKFAKGTTEVLNDALRRLPKRLHLGLISKCAQLEFKMGSAETGRNIFEGVVANYPKKLDIWNVYLDQEIARMDGQGRRARQLFERVVSLKFSSKKMKFLFKKYLQFEEQHGTEDQEEHVKALARSWVAARS